VSVVTPLSLAQPHHAHPNPAHPNRGRASRRLAHPGYLNVIKNDEDAFRLDSGFLTDYHGRRPQFGYNGLGEFVFYRTYSRLKDNGCKESFLDVVTRVVEGCYEIQRRHCRQLHIPWDYDKALLSAHEMFQRMWAFKFLPPGRGLWCMGTPFMWERGSAALNNCGFVSTEDIRTDPAEPFCFLMDMSMLGVGVGFDTKGAGHITIQRPHWTTHTSHQIADSREGWVESVRLLIDSYTISPEIGLIEFDYSLVRPAGTPIRGFGGVASGPGNLAELHELIRAFLESRIGKQLSSIDIVDVMNMIGACVVAGNVRRTAEIAFGDADDFAYTSMKNPVLGLEGDEITSFYTVTGRIYDDALAAHGPRTVVTTDLEQYEAIRLDLNRARRQALADANGQADAMARDPRYKELVAIGPDRLGKCVDTWNVLNRYRWASNNSVFSHVGMDYGPHASNTAVNGEPGYVWLDNIRDYGRFIDGKKVGIDGRAAGTNPCGEQSLESYELCNLVETFPSFHDDSRDYLRTLKFAYLYAKTVTLLPTHNVRTNSVTLRNRRIGLSQSGIVQAFAKFGRRRVLQDFCNDGYDEVRRWDNIYSDWLCIGRSIKVTCVKPSGTVSLVVGVPPGIHYPESRTYWRRARVAWDSPLIAILQRAGYLVEPDLKDKATAVVTFGVDESHLPSVDDISVWQQVMNVVDYQCYWADNQPSCTVKFKPYEAKEIKPILEAVEDRLKCVAFAPHRDHGYVQAPYEPAPAEDVRAYNARLLPIDFNQWVTEEATGTKFCDSDKCQLH